MIAPVVILQLPSRDQGPRGSCVAFAIAGIQGHFANYVLSPEYAYLATALSSPAWQPNQGLDVRVAVGATAAGLPEEQYFPYQPHEPPQPLPQLPSGLLLHGPTLKLISKDPADIEAALSKGRPVGLLISLTQSFMKPVDGIVAFEPNVYPGRHAVIVAGFGTHLNGEPYYLLCNSWGNGWGTNGHAWIPQAYLIQHASCAYGV